MNYSTNQYVWDFLLSHAVMWCDDPILTCARKLQAVKPV